ncbi:hypothetical protein Y032_0195g1486 [Ancylostoma ceylanicum]|uniref:Uncharacterized protein n=1 Tax=Ancylostoma ceylanicum TaxID=53326 RepID=A0A016SPN2_9BILA|nr:hypothetical protein Y032_0195g1486 [Ancylostoma ceylanicum]
MTLNVWKYGKIRFKVCSRQSINTFSKMRKLETTKHIEKTLQFVVAERILARAARSHRVPLEATVRPPPSTPTVAPWGHT